MGAGKRKTMIDAGEIGNVKFLMSLKELLMKEEFEIEVSSV